MKGNRFDLGAILLLAMAIGGCLCVGSLVVQILNPFPVREFVDASGPAASRELHPWDFTVDPSDIQRVSMKSASSIDSYSKWSKFTLSASNGKTLSDELHNRKEVIDEYLQRMYECEQTTRTITSIPIRKPTSETPAWWAAPTGTGRATENMLWDPPGSPHGTAQAGTGRAKENMLSKPPGWSYGGTAQGCYTIYDSKTRTLWAYEFAAQGHLLWERGTRPTYGNQAAASKP